VDLDVRLVNVVAYNSIKCGGIGLNLVVANRVIKCVICRYIKKLHADATTKHGFILELRN
jgi:hypothetical protein